MIYWKNRYCYWFIISSQRLCHVNKMFQRTLFSWEIFVNFSTMENILFLCWMDDVNCASICSFIFSTKLLCNSSNLLISSQYTNARASLCKNKICCHEFHQWMFQVSPKHIHTHDFSIFCNVLYQISKFNKVFFHWTQRYYCRSNKFLFSFVFLNNTLTFLQYYLN